MSVHCDCGGNHEPWQHRERERIVDITGIDAIIDAFLASPQAAEELARAAGSIGPGWWTVATPEDAAAILAAWQKVRHPEG